MTALTPNFHAYVMAVERVEQRLKKVTAALDAAKVPYAVIGGCAVAAWVARVDPGATRSTKDVDILVDREDVQSLSEVMRSLRFMQEDVLGVRIFVDPEEPSVRSAVHIVWAGEPVRPGYSVPAPSVEESGVDPQGFRVINLDALVRMKLTSFRLIDQVHVQDLLRMELINDAVRESLPAALRERLDHVQQTMEPEE